MNAPNRRKKRSSFSYRTLFSFLKRDRGSVPAHKPDSADRGALRGAQQIADGAVRETEQASASYLMLFTLLSILASIALIYHLHLRFEGVRLGYETSRARAERARLVAEQRELRLELSSLKAPERVEAEAQERLGMVMPGNERIIPIDKRAAQVVASGRAR